MLPTPLSNFIIPLDRDGYSKSGIIEKNIHEYSKIMFVNRPISDNPSILNVFESSGDFDMEYHTLSELTDILVDDIKCGMAIIFENFYINDLARDIKFLIEFFEFLVIIENARRRQGNSTIIFLII